MKAIILKEFGNVDNQVALITEAGRGLGLEYAKLLSQRAAHIIIQDTRVDKDS